MRNIILYAVALSFFIGWAAAGIDLSNETETPSPVTVDTPSWLDTANTADIDIPGPLFEISRPTTPAGKYSLPNNTTIYHPGWSFLLGGENLSISMNNGTAAEIVWGAVLLDGANRTASVEQDGCDLFLGGIGDIVDFHVLGDRITFYAFPMDKCKEFVSKELWIHCDLGNNMVSLTTYYTA